MKKVTAAVIESDGKILIARRKKGDPLEHKWEFPGGKLAGGETPEECLRRELHEEFGIEVKVQEFICSSKFEYPHISIELLAYRVSYLSGEFKLRDHEEIEWVSPDRFHKYDFADADIPIAQRIKEGLRHGL